MFNKDIDINEKISSQYNNNIICIPHAHIVDHKACPMKYDNYDWSSHNDGTSMANYLWLICMSLCAMDSNLQNNRGGVHHTINFKNNVSDFRSVITLKLQKGTNIDIEDKRWL